MAEQEKDILELAIDDIQNSDLSEAEKTEVTRRLQNLRSQKINILITGATGCGKSSTINALFDTEVATVGVGVDPETMDIQKYELKNMVLWDSPGLGDGKEADNRHAKNIISKLHEKNNEGNALIDLVLVILDGGTRDLGTSYELINSVIIPNLGEDKQKRILVAINQCDMAMRGRHWDSINNKPDEVLVSFLDEKVASVKRRIYDGTGVDIEPIYYSAGYKEGNEKQNPYNLSKLLYFIIKHTPKKKRIIYVENISKNDEMWKSNDNLKDYSHEIKKSFFESVVAGASAGAAAGEAVGSIFGRTGAKIGRAIGGVCGAVCGAIGSFFGW